MSLFLQNNVNNNSKLFGFRFVFSFKLLIFAASCHNYPCGKLSDINGKLSYY